MSEVSFAIGDDCTRTELNQQQRRSQYTDNNQSWSATNVNKHTRKARIPLEAPTRHVSECKPAYTNNTRCEPCVDQQVYLPQQGQTITSNQLNQFIENTQFPLEDMHMQLRTDYTQAPDITRPSAPSYETESYRKNPQFSNTTTTPVKRPKTVQNVAYDVSCAENPVTVLPVHMNGCDESEGDCISEDRSGEKKLTTTPIPSDADKMSSSGSVSSESMEEAPSPRDLEAEEFVKKTILSTAPAIKETSIDTLSKFKTYDMSVVSQIEQTGTGKDLSKSRNFGYSKSLSKAKQVFPSNKNSIELDVDVRSGDVELTESNANPTSVSSALTSGVNFNAATFAQNRPVSDVCVPPKSITTSPSSNCNLAVHNRNMKHHHKYDLMTSWSVLKEERKKYKLEKKAKKLKHRNKEKNFVKDCDMEHSNKNEKYLLRRLHHQSKHHPNIQDAQIYSELSPKNVLPLSSVKSGTVETHSLPSNDCSRLIPKVTADPTKNSILVTTPPKRVKGQRRKENSLKKKIYSNVHRTNQKRNDADVLTRNSLSNDSKPIDNRLPNGIGVNYWQTVTAVQDPKLPPVLSEQDRIPKRGRPSKKMSAINLKLKSDAVLKYKEIVKVKSSEKTNTSVSGQQVVATYKINEKGLIEELESKHKENRRNKERNEAFKSMLSKISQKSTIQKKTARAKDVVGEFKAIGVRTRKQASTDSVSGKQKQVQERGKSHGRTENALISKLPSPKTLSQDVTYTVDELAKKYKISDSILHRAMEQSQRNSVYRKRSSAKKVKESNSTNQDDMLLGESNVVVLTQDSQGSERVKYSDSAKTCNAEETSLLLQSHRNNCSFDQSQPVIKPTFPFSHTGKFDEDGILKKRKKKKHRKERDGNKFVKVRIKKKKCKQKNKQRRNLSDSNFTTESDQVLSITEQNSSTTFDKAQLLQSPAKAEVSKSCVKTGAGEIPTVKCKISSQSNKNDSIAVSTSSFSGCKKTCDLGESSSDLNINLKNKNILNKGKRRSNASNAIVKTTAQTTVFGSGISSMLPSFQGIKEHGGLMQYFQYSSKKQKHKKRKHVNCINNASNRKFNFQMEDLVNHFNLLKLTTIMQFLRDSSVVKTSNVFANCASSSSSTAHSANYSSYLDPAKDISKQKCQNILDRKITTNSNQTSPDLANISVFCHSEFFRKHGYIKPFALNLANTFVKAAHPASTSMHKATLFSAHDSKFLSQQCNNPELKLKQKPPLQKQVDGAKVPVIKPVSKRITKRKRGWPRGKPRGPKCKKSYLDAGTSCDPNINRPDASKSKLKRSHSINKQISKTATARNGSVTLHSGNIVSAVSDVSTNANLRKRRKTKLEDDVCNQVAGKNTVKTLPKNNLPERNAPANPRLVDHIKAALTAKFTTTDFCPDTVAKTVGTAVASYIEQCSTKGVILDSALTTPVSSHSCTVDTNSKIKIPATKPSPPTSNSSKLAKRPRGRPLKYPKLQPKTDLNSSSEALKNTSNKYPEKSWTSVHSSLSGTVSSLKGKPKKRGPGRPRKYPLETSLNQRKKKVTITTSHSIKNSFTSVESSPFPVSSRRASALYIPSARNVHKQSSSASSMIKAHRTICTKGAGTPDLKKDELSDRMDTKTRSENKELTSDVISECDDAICSNMALEHSIDASSLPTSPQALEPNVSANTNIDAHMLELGNNTFGGCCFAKENDNNTRQPRTSVSSDSSQRGSNKKKLELVVAKLKSKQVSMKNLNITNTPNTDDVFEDQSNDMDNSTIKNVLKSRGSLSFPALMTNANEVPCRLSALSHKYSSVVTKNVIESSSPNSSLTTDGRISTNIAREQSESCVETFRRSRLSSASLKSGSKDDCKVEEDRGQTLLDSIDNTREYLLKNHDFQLSHNIWKMFQQTLIATAQDIPPTFIKIRRNIYVDIEPVVQQDEHVCECHLVDVTESPACGKDCLNRLMYIECSSDACPCDERCSNRAIQDGQWFSNVERFRTSCKGWGIRATSLIPEGQFILEYVGEVMSGIEFRRRTTKECGTLRDHYCVQLETDKVIDGYHMANEGRFVNHSCQPNCEMQKWVSNGEYRICLFSKRLIAEGEELTYDYNFHAFNLEQQQICRCGTPVCRGFIGGRTRRSRVKALFGRESKESKLLVDGERSSQSVRTTTCESDIRRMTAEEKTLIRQWRIFLFRNLMQMNGRPERVKRSYKERSKCLDKFADCQPVDFKDEKNTFSMLYNSFNTIFSEMISYKDDNGVLIAILLFKLSTDRSNTEQGKYNHDFVDLCCIEDKIAMKRYNNLYQFSTDFLRVFQNAEKHYAEKKDLSKHIEELHEVFTIVRNVTLGKISENEVSIDRQLALEDRSKNSDCIRCICGIQQEEGLMIECEKCFVWQHCDCMKVTASDYTGGKPYLCEQCDHRKMHEEIEVIQQPPNALPGCTYYHTLSKDNMLIKQHCFVRLIHDHSIRQSLSDQTLVQTSFRSQNVGLDCFDFFRIKKLWIDSSGNKFAYGQHYIRPHDTKHIKSRLFFANELLASPYHEIAPLTAVNSLCCVLDLATYKKGRPIGVEECDIYICQHSVDLWLRIVKRVVKKIHPICTKPGVFDAFPTKLTTVRDFQVSEELRKTQSRRTRWLTSLDYTKTDQGEANCAEYAKEGAVKHVKPENSVEGKERDLKKKRLNGILSKLLKQANSKKRKAVTR